MLPEKLRNTKLSAGERQSQVFSGNEEQTLGSTMDVAKQTQFQKAQLENQRSLSQQPQPGATGGLPMLAGPKPGAATKFQWMYNRNFVLNIDNDVTNRNNRQFISGYYQQLSNDSVTPSQQHLNYQSLRALDARSPVKVRKDGLNFQDRILNSNSEMKANQFSFQGHDQSGTLQQELMSQLPSNNQISQQRMANSATKTFQDQSPMTVSTATKLPVLVKDTSIMTTLHDGIQLSAKFKAAKLIGETERKKHRKDLTMNLMGMADQESHTSERPFKPRGTLERPLDENSEFSTPASQKTQSFINSSVFNVLEENYEDYLKEIEEQKEFIHKQNMKVRSKLIPAERLKFDQDEEFARKKILENKTAKEEDEEYSGSEDDLPEPERNFGKLRARIKLKSIKKFDEDERRQKKLQQKAAEIAATGGETRLTSAQKKRKKHEPIKRRRSFTECQLKFEDGLELYDAEKANNKAHTLTDLATINKMKKNARWPIPEALLNQPEHYWLKIDSIIHGIYDTEPLVSNCQRRPQLKAPQNSDVSEDNLSIGGWSDDVVEEAPKEESDQEEKKVVDQSLLVFQPFNLDMLTVFPHKNRDGDFPKRVLMTQSSDYLVRVCKGLAQQQEQEKHQLTPEVLQEVFDHYCDHFKVESIEIQDYIFVTSQDKTHEKRKLSIRNVMLSENLMKALSATIPFMHNIHEVEFVQNSITDMMSSILLIAAFAAPSVRRFSYVGNFGRATFRATFAELVKADPRKFMELNVSRSFTAVEIMEQLSRSFSRNMIKLNISGCDLSMSACRVLNKFLLEQMNIKDFNVARCKLAHQGARYIIDALNRNSTIRHLNISFNDFTSGIYEFSIKIASMLTRHPTLLHCDLTQCGFKRQECMFIIIAMSLSKSFLALHLTGNDLSYYERVFMRSLISARVQFQFKSEEQRQEIKLNKERAQIMHLAGGKEHLYSQLQEYLKVFDELDEQRQGLDFEIAELMEQLNMERQYSKIRQEAKLDDLPEDSPLAELINKMVERTHDIDKQQEQVKDMIRMTGPEIKERLRQLSGNDIEQQLNMKLNGVDPFQANQTKDQQRIRAEQLALKSKKDRSAGEMALLFMGINQVAFDLLIENPMTGYMNDIIYSRILGHDDIEQANYWSDTTQCYVCQKWNKQVIRFDPRHDVSKWSQRITQVNNLKTTIDKLYVQAEEVEVVRQAKANEEEKDQLEHEIERRKAIGEYSSDSDSHAQKATQDTATQRDNPFNKRIEKKQGPQKGTKLKINLKPDQEAMNQTASQLKAVGPELISPRFSGKSGISPRAQDVVRKTRGSIFAEDVSPRSNIKSTVDGGAFTSAIKKQQGKGSIPLERSDTPIENIVRPGKRALNSENPMAPNAVTIQKVQSHIFPEQFVNANDFLELNLQMSDFETDEADDRNVSHNVHDNYLRTKQKSRYGGPPKAPNPNSFGGQFGQRSKNQKAQQLASEKPNLRDLTQHVLRKNQDQFKPLVPNTPAHSVAPSVTTNIQGLGAGRRRGQPTKVQRTLIFQGMVYVIEEEVYSDSDNSSVYTSEDDFEEDPGMIPYLVQQQKEYDEQQAQILAAKLKQKSNPVMTKEEKYKKEKLGLKNKKFDHLDYSKEQKEYKTKIWPKHYIDHLKNEKVNGLDKVGGDLKIRVGGKILNAENAVEDRGQEIVSGPLEGGSEKIFIVGSFNDWMPTPLKTQRELTFEKINPEDPVPKQVFVMDNIIQLYANFMTPGRHYFYFVKSENTIVLSPNYEIIRFKTTNVFLNSVIVKPNIYEYDQIALVKGQDEEEPVFLKDKSVFRDFKDDTKKFLDECFRQDIEFSKLSRAMKEPPEGVQNVILLLNQNFVRLKNIWLYYIGISEAVTIGLNEFTSWAKKCNLVDHKFIDSSALDRLLITTNVTSHGLTSNAERDLNRYEFLELIVRAAIMLYNNKQAPVDANAAEATKRILLENIYPNSFNVDGEYFRRMQCYNVKVNEILKKNEKVIKLVYDQFTHAKKKFVRMDECQQVVRKAEIIVETTRAPIADKQVGVIYAESMQTLIDTITDQTKPNQMKYVEFLVFICRISFERYRDSPYESEHMYLKLEKTLPLFLDQVNESPQFLFYEEFDYKPPVKKRGRRRAPVVVKVEQKKDEENKEPQPVEEEEEEEEEDESSDEDLGQVVILADDKYELSNAYIKKMAREKKEKEERKEAREKRKQKKEEERIKAEEEKRLLDALADPSDNEKDDDLDDDADQQQMEPRSAKMEEEIAEQQNEGDDNKSDD